MDKSQLDELWIGDEVWLEPIQRNVFFEGYLAASDQVKIKYHGVQRTVNRSDIAKARPQTTNIEPSATTTKQSKAKTAFAPVEKTIDLHIEHLNPGLQHERAEIILEHQIKRCTTFVHQAIQARRPHVTIIHGKGEGVLRLEVEHLLADFKEVNFVLPANNGGASEVWFQYHS